MFGNGTLKLHTVSISQSTINNHDGFFPITVFGWLRDSFIDVERASTYTLPAGYCKGGEQAGVNISFNIVAQAQTASELLLS